MWVCLWGPPPAQSRRSAVQCRTRLWDSGERGIRRAKSWEHIGRRAHRVLLQALKKGWNIRLCTKQTHGHRAIATPAPPLHQLHLLLLLQCCRRRRREGRRSSAARGASWRVQLSRPLLHAVCPVVLPVEVLLRVHLVLWGSGAAGGVRGV